MNEGDIITEDNHKPRNQPLWKEDEHKNMAHTIPAARREDEIRIASDVWWQIHFAFAQVNSICQAQKQKYRMKFENF